MSSAQVVPMSQVRPWQSKGAAAAAVAAVVLVLTAFAAYALGTRDGNRVRALTGNAYVGARVASVNVDGWSYGIEGSVAWVDGSGTSHDSGWPACLSTVGTTVRIRFGEITVTGPQDNSWRQVVWVDCRGAVLVH